MALKRSLGLPPRKIHLQRPIEDLTSLLGAPFFAALLSLSFILPLSLEKIIGFFVSGIFFVYYFRCFISYLIVNRLLCVYGTVIQGKVTAKRLRRLKPGRDREYVVSFSFSDQKGQKRHGKVITVQCPANIGQEVMVLYFPFMPFLNTIYEYSGYSVVKVEQNIT